MAAALLGLLFFLFLSKAPSPRGVAQPVPATAASVPAVSAVAPATPRGAPRLSAPPAQADSLRGTDVDGSVRRDAQGHVVADRELRRLFDYFLSRLGERDTVQIRADLLAWLQSQAQLDARARAEVLNLFDRYAELQRASAALGRSSDLRADLQRLRELRRRELGESLAQAWFGEEEDYAAATLERLALARDNTLDLATRTQRLAQVEASVDPRQRASRADSTDYQLAVVQSEQLDTQHADASQRVQQRTELWGADAAARLAELDQQDLDWQLRLRAYAQAREKLFADGTLASGERELRLLKLLEVFSEAEQRRVLSLAEEGLLPK
ncbi:lipase chaperone LimK [Tahibacter aquaticus]|uniref:Lipase chaperone n=2 Tax=Tahibacter aquaticus TaxID=520092 RepID=A0A4R6YTU7_9GAMM|nr:lipase chaperone LimK [Tahibacter aquaticus]